MLEPPYLRCHIHPSWPWTHLRWRFVPLVLLRLSLIVLALGAVAQVDAMDDAGVLLQSTLDRLARRGEILVDHRPPPTPMSLQRRQLFSTPDTTSSSSSSLSRSTTDASTSTTSPPRPSSSGSSSSSSSTNPSSTSTVSTDPNPGENAPLPTAFDTSLGANFSSNSCPEFFRQSLNNNEFRACLPFSLLLQNSNSFFQAERSVVRITQTLDATCNVNLNTCSNLLSRLALEIRKDNNCGQDLKDQNPLVVQAYNGMVAYQPLYQAGCLKSSTGSYCFADAITNVSSPSDSYIYYMPLGLPLPGGSRPASCTPCLQNSMSIFATAASNASQPASRNYVATAQLINLSCGPNFVNATIPPAKGGASSSIYHQLPPHRSLVGISLLVMLFFFFIGDWF